MALPKRWWLLPFNGSYRTGKLFEHADAADIHDRGMQAFTFLLGDKNEIIVQGFFDSDKPGLWVMTAYDRMTYTQIVTEHARRERHCFDKIVAKLTLLKYL